MATQYITCPNCHSQNPGNFTTCTNCGTMLPAVHMPMQPAGGYGAQVKHPGADKKIAAGICGIVLGGLGIHKFILGYTQEGVILLSVYLVAIVIAIITCGIGTPLVLVPSVIGIIEGIIYLTKSDEEFVQTYIVNKKPWF
jgi:TM2 domain-containing membrane protein YozV